MERERWTFEHDALGGPPLSGRVTCELGDYMVGSAREWGLSGSEATELNAILDQAESRAYSGLGDSCAPDVERIIREFIGDRPESESYEWNHR